ncbi:MAG TPA: PAS domain S-box protein [Gemmataceae bacterium]|nr:PAS domain S-box protein [Gemmataceae bacterium]
MPEPRPGRDTKADDSRAGVTPPAPGRYPVPDDDPLVITPVRGRIPRPFPIGESRVLSTEPREPGAVKRDSGVTNRDSFDADRAAQDDSRTASYDPRFAGPFRRSVDDVLDVGLMAADVEGRQTYVNPAFCRMVGWSAEELIGAEPPLVYWDPNEVEKIRGVFAELVDAGGPARAEVSFRRRGGERFTAGVRAAPMVGEGGRLIGLLATVIDLNESRRIAAEREILLRERADLADRLGLLLETTAEGIYGIDGEGRCTFANRAAVRLLGYPSGDLLGKKVHELLHKTRADGSAVSEEQCPLCRPGVDERGRRLKGEVFWRRDGESFPVECSSHPIVHEGTFAGAVVSFTDLTDRESLEAQLRQAQKMEAVGRLAGGLAHDFNNLLTVINGYTEMVLAGLAPGDRSVELLSEIRKAGERAASLTGQLLIFSRRQVVVPKVIDLNAAVADAEKMLRRLIGEDIECVVQAGARPGLVKMDPGQLQQILLNLAVNARDAMPGGGRISIQTADVELDVAYARSHLDVRPGSYVLLAVKDTGCGMTEEIQARIFEPFFTTKEAGKGTGLGLSTVYGIVKQSAGHIEVDSAPGRGTTFRVYLPCGHGAVAPGKAGRPLQKAGRSAGTVLIVEDEDMVRGMIRTVMQWNGYTILEARHGAEALALCDQYPRPIDLLITDIVMPKMNGRELSEKLLKLRPNLKVLYISGYAGETLSKLDQKDVGNFLQKPFTPNVLAQKVHETLERE